MMQAKDMTMKSGFNFDALYFHAPNTAIQVASGTAIMAAVDGALSLNIPAWWTLPTAVAFATVHNVAWNSLHLDMHEAS